MRRYQYRCAAWRIGEGEKEREIERSDKAQELEIKKGGWAGGGLRNPEILVEKSEAYLYVTVIRSGEHRRSPQPPHRSGDSELTASVHLGASDIFG